MNYEKLKILLERSGGFQADVHEFASGLIPADGKRYLVALQAGLLSLQHAAGALVLISQGFYPAQLTYDVVRNSNAIVALATQLIAILTGDPRNMEHVRRFHVEYSDCLPIQ